MLLPHLTSYIFLADVKYAMLFNTFLVVTWLARSLRSFLLANLLLLLLLSKYLQFALNFRRVTLPCIPLLGLEGWRWPELPMFQQTWCLDKLTYFEWPALKGFSAFLLAKLIPWLVELWWFSKSWVIFWSM